MKYIKFFILWAVLFLPVLSLASIDANLKYGARGQEVTELQEFLIDKGFLQSQATGNFYSLTQKAAIAYQTSEQLPATGYVGPLTRAKINAELDAENAVATQDETDETGTTSTPIDTSPSAMSQARIDQLVQQIKDLLAQTQAQTAQVQAQTTQIQQQTQILGQIQQQTVPAPVQTTPTQSAPTTAIFTLPSDIIPSCITTEDGKMKCIFDISIKYQENYLGQITTPNGKSITINIPDLNYTNTAQTISPTGSKDSIAALFSNIPVTMDGIYPVMVTSSNGTYTGNLTINSIQKIKDADCQSYGVYCNGSDVTYSDMTPTVTSVDVSNFQAQNQYVIGEIKLLGLTNFAMTDLSVDTNPNFQYITDGSGLARGGSGIISFSNNTIMFLANSFTPKGTYTLTIKSISAKGQETGTVKTFGGLPITFTFTIK